jgi:hypothetical protein
MLKLHRQNCRQNYVISKLKGQKPTAVQRARRFQDVICSELQQQTINFLKTVPPFLLTRGSVY